MFLTEAIYGAVIFKICISGTLVWKLLYRWLEIGHTHSLHILEKKTQACMWARSAIIIVVCSFPTIFSLGFMLYITGIFSFFNLNFKQRQVPLTTCSTWLCRIHFENNNKNLMVSTARTILDVYLCHTFSPCSQFLYVAFGKKISSHLTNSLSFNFFILSVLFSIFFSTWHLCLFISLHIDITLCVVIFFFLHLFFSLFLFIELFLLLRQWKQKSEENEKKEECNTVKGANTHKNEFNLHFIVHPV